MSKSQLSFFATKSDLGSPLRKLESTQQFQYVISGLFDWPEIVSMQSLFDAPNLGIAPIGDINQSPGYLVSDKATCIEVRPVPQRRGGTKYAVDQTINPKTITFRPGGVFGQNCLIAGQVGTASEDFNSHKLFQLFSKEIRAQFTKVKSFYVGKEATQLLNDGWRLTANAKSPALHDLSID